MHVRLVSQEEGKSVSVMKEGCHRYCSAGIILFLKL